MKLAGVSNFRIQPMEATSWRHDEATIFCIPGRVVGVRSHHGDRQENKRTIHEYFVRCASRNIRDHRGRGTPTGGNYPMGASSLTDFHTVRRR